VIQTESKYTSQAWFRLRKFPWLSVFLNHETRFHITELAAVLSVGARWVGAQSAGAQSVEAQWVEAQWVEAQSAGAQSVEAQSVEAQWVEARSEEG
jgi:hypothetical protein